MTISEQRLAHPEPDTTQNLTRPETNSEQKLARPEPDTTHDPAKIPAESLRVQGMFFSGTGTTKTIVTAVAAALEKELKISEKSPDIDFTPPAARERAYRFELQDIVVFGVPVIAGRVPNVLLPFLNTLEGGGAMAIPVVLYGNRNFDDALIELRNILEERGFHTVAAAAFIGEHSFSRILAAGRPDEADLQIARKFAADTARKIEGLLAKAEASLASAEPEATPSVEIGAAAGELTQAADGTEPGFGAEGVAARMLQLLHEAGPIEVDGEDPIRPYYKPRDRQGNHINILKLKPKLDAEKCTKCGICVAACPMGSIKPEAPGVVDGICIKCCGCEKKCPEGALYFDDEGYLYHKTELELGYPDRKEPKLFI